MTQGSVTYAGVLLAKGAIYTQVRGVAPGKVSVQIVPQSTSLAAVGAVTFIYGIETQTLPDCLADKSNVHISPSGFKGSITLQDRRWRWSRYPSVSYHFNERDTNGNLIAATLFSHRQIVTQLLADIGETNIDVSAVATNFYPEVDVYCMRPDTLLDQVTSDWGYGICLGFNADPVKVVQVGVGESLPTENLMAAAEGLDPPTPPQYVRVCFAPSVAQARFKMIAVGMDTDGNIKPIADLSYAPLSGWETENPEMPNVLKTYDKDSDEYKLAIKTVFRWYIPATFADGGLNLPDGSGLISSINQVLPMLPQLVETEFINGVPYNPQPRVYGIHMQRTAPVRLPSLINDEVGFPFTFDEHRGLVAFSEAVFVSNTVEETISPSELYLESAFRLRNSVTNQLASYMKDTEVSSSGFGYHSINDPTNFARTVVTYDSDHVVTGTITNRVNLDSLAAEYSANALGMYTYSARDVGWYNRPKFDIRLDGLISQIKHVITDGDSNEPGHHTVASRNMNTDPFTRTEPQKQRDMFVLSQRSDLTRDMVAKQKVLKGNE